MKALKRMLLDICMYIIVAMPCIVMEMETWLIYLIAWWGGRTSHYILELLWPTINIPENDH